MSMMDLRSGDTPSTVRLWSFGEDAMLEDDAVPGALTLVTRWGEREIVGSSPTIVESLRRMAYGPVSLHNTLHRSHGTGAADVEELEQLIDSLGGAVVHSLGLPDGKGPLLTAVPVSSRAVLHPRPVSPDMIVRLSRYAMMRPIVGGVVLEVPEAPFSVQLSLPTGAAFVVGMAAPSTPRELAGSTGVSTGVATDLVSFLVAAGHLVIVDSGSGAAADETRAMRGWAPHELQFHVRSRSSQGDRPSDDVAADAVSAPSPIMKPAPVGRRFPLPEPGRHDPGPPLGDLLERDHTRPVVSGPGLTVGQLGELLHRSARVRSVGPAYVPGPDPGLGHAASQRPYLSTACLYELELYLTVDRCAGLPRGVFHYDPLGHALTLVEDAPDVIDELLDIGRVGCGSIRQPAVVITVTARLDRLTWLFAGSAYAVALKHCGLFQAVLYLVGAAMGISAHALPAGGGRRTDDLTGAPWPAEVGVGESILDPARSAPPDPG